MGYRPGALTQEDSLRFRLLCARAVKGIANLKGSTWLGRESVFSHKLMDASLHHSWDTALPHICALTLYDGFW